jgi:hypothetical protein
MPIDRVRLREQLVYLECVDAHYLQLDARGYQRAAHALRQAVLTELSAVPMQEFVHGDLPALQTIAQNVFFETRGRFADLDGSSSTRRVAEVASALFNRLMKQRR